MLKSGGAATRMQMDLNPEVLKKIECLSGSLEDVKSIQAIRSLEPFEDEIIDFLDEVSKTIMKDALCKKYADVITFAFWIRKSNTLRLKERFCKDKDSFRLGRGIVFHIAPSNVPVNFAYSLVAGLLTGNANIVRVPSKNFEQVDLITKAFNKVVADKSFFNQYITCVRYDRNKEINDLFSGLADVRVLWGGDETIDELRKSPMKPRATEITFADRYSLAVINSDSYMKNSDKKRIAEDFYNDTFLTDQNACTSPRLVVWTGSCIDSAKELFWEAEHDVAIKKYNYQSIQGTNKLTKAFLAAEAFDGLKIINRKDNLIVRLSLPYIPANLMDYRDNSGFFYEYDCNDINDIIPICDDKHCQTVAYIGDREELLQLAKSGIKGIDRIVPIGHTMDFDLIWDGYNLVSELTRELGMGSLRYENPEGIYT